MRWQFGGNLQPVRMICEFDWKECPIAVVNYVWSEIVTDVVDCLTNETVLWRMVAVLLVFTMLLHMAYYKVGWVDEAELNRDCFNKVGYKVQDLELKVNILSYKMRYGTWPMPHEIRTPSLKELRNVRLTLSNTSRHSFWTKHPFTDHDRNTTCVTFSKHKLHSMQHLAKLFNFETQYISSTFEPEVSPINRSSRKITGRSSRCKQKSIRCPKKKDSPVQFEKGDSCPNRMQPQKHARLVRSQNNSKTNEELMMKTDECRNNQEEIKANSKSLDLIGSFSEINVGNLAKDVFVETQPEESIHLKDPKPWYKICTCEDDEEEESHENDLNVSNHIAADSRLANEKSLYPQTDMIFSAGGEQYATESSPRVKKPMTLPPGLSITLLTEKYHSVPAIERRVAPEKRKLNRTKESTSETLCRVKDKLENIHNVLQTCEPRDMKISSSTTIDEDIRSADSKTSLYGIQQNYDNKSVGKNVNMNKNHGKDEQMSTSYYEECENERMVSTSFSWASVEQLDAVFGVQDETAENNFTCNTNLMDSAVGYSPERRINIQHSNVERTCKEIHKMNNDQQEFIVCKKVYVQDSSLNAHLPASNNIETVVDDNRNMENDEKTKTDPSEFLSQQISSPSLKNSFLNSSPRNAKITEKEDRTEEEKPILTHNDSVGANQYKNPNARGTFNSHTSPQNFSHLYDSTMNTNLNTTGNINIKYPKDGSQSATQKKLIPLTDAEVSYEFESNCQTMETDDDMTVISLSSSQIELSTSRATDDQSTATLLREALEFKKVLLMQIEKESQMANKKESTNENNKYDSDDTLKSKNDNHFQSKLLDIISEEQSASSSMEKPSKTYILPELPNEKHSRGNFTKPITSIENNRNHSHDKTNIEYESLAGSQSALASTSSEYFSVIDKIDNEQTSRHSAGDYVSNQKLNEKETMTREDTSLLFTKSHSSGIHRLDRSKHFQTAYKNNAIVRKSKAESNTNLKYCICPESATDNQVEKTTEKLMYNNREQVTKNRELSVSLKHEPKLYKDKIVLQEEEGIEENTHRSAAKCLNEKQHDSKGKPKIPLYVKLDKLENTRQDLDNIDNSGADNTAIGGNTIKKVHNSDRSIDDLLLENIQSMKSYAQITSENHSNGIPSTHQAVVEEKQRSHNDKVIENWNLNFLEPESQVPWNPMTESSSDESITQFINALTSRDSKKIDAITGQKLLTLKSTKFGGQHFAAAGESVKCNPNLDLKRRPGTFSIASTNSFENNTGTNREIPGTMKPRKRSRNSPENCDITMGTSNICSDEFSTLELQSNKKYDLEKMQRRHDILTKLKTLVAFTKPLENSGRNLEENKIAGDDSPQSGRTIICTLNTVESQAELTGIMHNDEQSRKSASENKSSNISDLKTKVNQRNMENDCSLEPNNNIKLISKNDDPLNDRNVRLEKYNINEKKSVEKSYSNLKSDPSSLYLTDNASSSNLLLDAMQNDDLIETFSLKNMNTVNKTLKETYASTEDKGNLKSELYNNEASDKTSKILYIGVLDSEKSLNLTRNQNAKCNELSTESSVEDDEKLMVSASEIELFEARVTPRSIEKQISIPSKTNMNRERSDSYIDICNNEFAVSSTTLFPDDSMLKASIKKTRHRSLSNGTVSNNTSASYVDASNHGFEAASNISLTLDKSILNPPPNKIEISALKKSISNSSKSNNGKTSGSKSTNSLQKRPKQVADLKKLRKSKTDVSEHATKNVKLLQKFPRRDMPAQSKQSSSKKSQLAARSNLNLSSSGLKSQLDTLQSQYSAQSSTNLTRSRSRSHVTPRRSQFSANSSSNLSPDHSKSERITETAQTKISVRSAKDKLASKASSRSCIPVLKTRVNERKTEFETRSKSPVRGPLTMSNPCREFSQPMFSVQDQSESIDQSKKTSFNVALQSEAHKNMPEEGKGEDIDKTSGELCGTIQKLDPVEHKGSNFVPEECTVIYVNIISDNEQSETRVGNPKEIMECTRNKDLMLQHLQPVSKDVVLSLNNIKFQSNNGGIEVMSHASLSDILNVTNSKGLTTTVFSSGMELKESNIVQLSNAIPLKNKHTATASKILSTSTLKGSWSFRVEQKEMEVSAKPSVMDNSTSVSDFPDVSSGRKSFSKEPQYKVYEIPKELNEEEHILLLEALDRDPNFFENRRSHKVCNKLELGLQDQPEQS